MENILFTPAALLEVLLSIEELNDKDISISENIDGTINLLVGESNYFLDVSNAEDVEVEEAVIDTVENVNESAYEDLEEAGEIELEHDPQSVESGLLKSALKSLMLGGMIRLSKKLLD